MALGSARRRLGLVFLGRCFWLFLVLLSFVGAVPFVEPTPLGRVVVGAANAFVVIAAVASVGRSALSFVIALLLGVPAFAFQLLAYDSGDVTLNVYMWAFRELPGLDGAPRRPLPAGSRGDAAAFAHQRVLPRGRQGAC